MSKNMSVGAFKALHLKQMRINIIIENPNYNITELNLN